MRGLHLIERYTAKQANETIDAEAAQLSSTLRLVPMSEDSSNRYEVSTSMYVAGRGTCPLSAMRSAPPPFLSRAFSLLAANITTRSRSGVAAVSPRRRAWHA